MISNILPRILNYSADRKIRMWHPVMRIIDNIDVREKQVNNIAYP